MTDTHTQKGERMLIRAASGLIPHAVESLQAPQTGETVTFSMEAA